MLGEDSPIARQKPSRQTCSVFQDSRAASHQKSAAIGSHSMRMFRLFFKMADTAAGNHLYTRAAGGGNTSLLLQKIQRPGTHTIPIAVATIQNCHDTGVAPFSIPAGSGKSNIESRRVLFCPLNDG